MFMLIGGGIHDINTHTINTLYNYCIHRGSCRIHLFVSILSVTLIVCHSDPPLSVMREELVYLRQFNLKDMLKPVGDELDVLRKQCLVLMI
jgi:hypothetical protein